MAVNLSPLGGVGAQFFDSNGNPLSGGLIYTYAAGTSTPQATYTTSAGSIQHSNPIVLDAAGRVPTGEIWLTDGISYKFTIKTSADVLVGTYDNIIGINSNFVNFTNQQEIQTATAGQTVFDLTTMQYQPGTNSLSVFVDGVNQYGPGAQYAYVETDSDTVTFVNGLHVGASVKFTTSQLNSSANGDASQISYTPPFVDSVTTNVADKLAQIVSVLDFGADPTGVSDSTAAIQAALDASNNVTFPDGSYLINSGITKTGDNVTIDFGNATIINGGAGYAFTFGVLADTYQNQGLSITGGYFIQNDPATVSNLNYILVRAIKDFTIKDCVMNNVSNGGITVYAGAQDGVIDNIKITDVSGYSTCRGIWLNGSTASDYASQLVDISSITRNATPVPVYAVKNVKVCNCTVVLPAYGVYNMNTRDTHIENCYIDISGGGARCIAINNYSPGAIINGNTLKGDQASTGILVTQFSHDVIIDGNTFLGSFGGGRDIYAQFLADCQITNNKFNTDSTQQILINMGATAIIRGNYFTRPSGVSTNVRCVLFTTIDEAVAGTSTYGNTATTLAGITFMDNVVKNRLSVVNVRALTAANGNIPGLDTVNVRNNIMYNFDSATGIDEYGMKITAPGTTYKIAYSYFDNTVYPAANANRNTVNITGTGVTDVRTDVQFAIIQCTSPAGGGSFTGTKLYGGFFSCGGAVTVPSNKVTISPRTIAGNTGASVAQAISIMDVSGVFASYDMIANGVNFDVRFYDTAGTIINLGTTSVPFNVVISGSNT